MPCTEPKRCWRVGVTENGKPNYVFKKPDYHWQYESQMVPCGKCISCKLQKSAEWATRAYHESMFHTDNCFVTLTYAQEHLPLNNSLSTEDLRIFIKKVRDYVRPHKFKYLACGEYGSKPKTGDIERPHYHICFFGIDFLDKYYFFSNKLGQPVYRSYKLEKLWPYGISSIAEFTYETAAYTSRYTLKKQTQEEKYEHVNVDTTTGEIIEQAKYERIMLRQGKQPEFIRMSKGIGLQWFTKFKSDTNKDYICSNGKKHKIPRYYDKKREESDPQFIEKIKEARKQKAKELRKDNTKVRRKSKDIIIKQSATKLPRGYDNGE